MNDTGVVMDETVNTTQSEKRNVEVTKGHIPFNGGEFKEERDSDLYNKWMKYKRNVELNMELNEIDRKKWKVYMLSVAGPIIQQLDKYLPDCEDEKDKELDEYAQLLLKLEKHFKPKRNLSLETSKFRDMMQGRDEKMKDFVLRLREQAERCEFQDTNQEVKIQVITKCYAKKLKEKLVLEERSLEQILNIAETFEMRDHYLQSGSEEKGRTEENLFAVRKYYARQDKRDNKDMNITCYACAYKGHRANDEKCPAKGQKCFNCGKLNHLAAACRSNKKRQRPDEDRNNGKEERYSKQQKSEQKNEQKEGTSSNFLFAIGKIKTDVVVSMGMVPVEVMIDSGSEVNCITVECWEMMKKNNVCVTNQKTANQLGSKLYGYGKENSINVRGQFTCIMEHRGVEVEAKVFVVEGGFVNILGRNTSTDLDILRIDCAINAVRETMPKMKGILLKYNIDRRVRPVKQSYRRPPVHLAEKVEKEIDRLLQLDIIEKVKTSEWISPIVTEIKKDGSIRLCVDMRRANKAIVREQYPLPTIEELLTSLAGSAFFSVLDLQSAYHQVELDEDSRDITTFISSKGLFRFKRLMFGVTCAPEVFQKLMIQILSDCEGAAVFIDDVVVHGKTLEIMEHRLQKVMKRLTSYDILLKEEKCFYGLTEIQFMGFKVNRDGVRVTEAKLQAIRELQRPNNVKDVQSVMGLFNFMRKYIPMQATIAEPLNKLTRKNVKFVWGYEEEKAFQKLKSCLYKKETLAHFDKNKRTALMTDASPVGLGAVLMQASSSNEYSIVAYASRSLSSAERRYCQQEKEALGIVWGTEYFHYFLYATTFILLTDHKPLKYIFNESSHPCLRVQRWVLRLQSYSYTVKYIEGDKNIADPFSRLCQKEQEVESFDEISEHVVASIISNDSNHILSLTKIREETRKDKVLSEVLEAIRTGRWKNYLARYAILREELCEYDSLILRGMRIVLPSSLRKSVLELAHSTHGKDKIMKGLMKDKVWWPGIDIDIHNFISQCKVCIINGKKNKPEPMTRKELPVGPWDEIAIDFVGPIEPDSTFILVVVDVYSRFCEAEIMNSTTTDLVIGKLKVMFGRYGIPRVITADNGPQFVSEMFKQYLIENGITLNLVAPYSPWQNGTVERQNKTLKAFIKATKESGKDWREELPEYLMNQHATINSTTNKSPSELFFKRILRNRIPDVVLLHQEDDEEDRDYDAFMKEKGKVHADESRKAKTMEIEVGNKVVLERQVRTSKLDSNFLPTEHEVIDKRGTEVIVENVDTAQKSRRNIVHCKKLPEEMSLVEEQEILEEEPINDNRGSEQQIQEGRVGRRGRNIVLPRKLRDYDMETD